jgi:hypothetical protein
MAKLSDEQKVFLRQHEEILRTKTAIEVFNNHKDFVQGLRVLKIGTFEDNEVIENAIATGDFGKTKFKNYISTKKKEYCPKKLNTNLENTVVKSEKRYIKKTDKIKVKQESQKNKLDQVERIFITKQPIHSTSNITTISTKINLKTELAKKVLKTIEKQVNFITITQRSVVKQHKDEFIKLKAVSKIKSESLNNTASLLLKEFQEYKQGLEKRKETILNDKKIENQDKQERLMNLSEYTITQLFDFECKIQSLYDRYTKNINQIYEIREKMSNELTKMPEALVKMQMAIKGTIENEKTMVDYGMIDININEKENNTQDNEIKKIIDSVRESKDDLMVVND